MSVEKDLEQYGLHIKYAEETEEPIDFSIEDKEDNVAWVWGDSHNVDFECWHPDQCVEFGDDDEQGRCSLCGSYCDWHWAKDIVDEGHDDAGSYYARSGETRVVSEWYPRRNVGGMIAELLDAMNEGDDAWTL